MNMIVVWASERESEGVWWR